MYKRYAYLIAALTTTLHLNAVRTREVVHHGFPTFEKAELTNLSLSEDGILAPGPTIETLAELQSALIWTVTRQRWHLCCYWKQGACTRHQSGG